MVIDQAEIARLRALYSPGGERGDLTMLRVLDEVERLRGEIAARSWAQNDRHNDELRYFAVGEKLAKERAEKTERERDEARAACAAMVLHRARQRTGESDPLIEVALNDAAGVGRPILDALKQAEEALREAASELHIIASYRDDHDVTIGMQMTAHGQHKAEQGALAALAALDGLRR